MKNKNIKNIRQGFTLAEVLMTLTIVGIVASITIPVIVDSYNDVIFRTSWRKVISEVNQFYRLAKVDGYAFEKYDEPTEEHPGADIFDVMANYLNPQIRCDGSGDTIGKCWANNVDKTYLSTDNCNIFNIDGEVNKKRGFVTRDGMYWLPYSWKWPIIAVDLNGPKGPNKWGIDILDFALTDDHIITPAEALSKNWPSYGYCLKAGVPNKALNYLTNN